MTKVMWQRKSTPKMVALKTYSTNCTYMYPSALKAGVFIEV